MLIPSVCALCYNYNFKSLTTGYWVERSLHLRKQLNGYQFYNVSAQFRTIFVFNKQQQSDCFPHTYAVAPRPQSVLILYEWILTLFYADVRHVQDLINSVPVQGP